MEKEAQEVLELLEKNGFSAFKVGGCVRDYLMGFPVHDIDIATSATPGEVMALFPYVIPTGIKHGTVTVIWKNQSFEVTTFRHDLSYSNHRQPDQVQFIKDITMDLSRRDFTVNAMALDRHGNLVDPYGGKHDLTARILRAVGHPDERFDEDALRILRAIRFSSRFSLMIEPNTWKAMKKKGSLLSSVSRERIRDELDRMIAGKNPEKAIKLLAVPGILPFPELRSLFCLTVGQQQVEKMEELAYLSRWVVLFIRAGWGEEKSARFLRDWRFPKKLIQEMMTLLSIAMRSSPTSIQGKKLLLAYGLEKVHEGLNISRWLSPTDPTLDLEIWKRWDQELPIRHQKELNITAQQLVDSFGCKPGPWLSRTLDTLFEQVALYGISNQREVLLEEARKVMNKSEGTDTENF